MKRYVAAAVIGLALALPWPVLAHHSFALFDSAKEVELMNATVVEWQWTSPHTWLFVMVPNGTGEPDKYSIEGGNPGQLRRVGFDKGSMSPGDKVTVYMAPLKDGQKGGAMNAVVLSDGKMLGSRLVQGQ